MQDRTNKAELRLLLSLAIIHISQLQSWCHAMHTANKPVFINFFLLHSCVREQPVRDSWPRYLVVSTSMAQETIDTNCMTLTRFILAEQKKYAPTGTGDIFNIFIFFLFDVCLVCWIYIALTLVWYKRLILLFMYGLQAPTHYSYEQLTPSN